MSVGIKKRTGQGPAIGLLTLVWLIAGLISFPSASALAEDLEMTISAQALDRFFQVVTPIRFKTEVMAGQSAVVTLSNPKIILAPGKPGQVWVEVDYEGKTDFLGLPPFTGKAKPEVKFQFDAKRGALEVTLKGVSVKGLPVDSLIRPYYLPLTSTEPMRMDGYTLSVESTAARTEVAEGGLRLMLNYNFVKKPL
ncbi:MAG: hypothetical protein AB1641_19115 [Thermodesulfobacteriota bacterium]